MRSWRNWQTRTVQVRVGNRGGSNPLDRTIFLEVDMQTKDCIVGRRSIRKYLDRKITPKQLEEIVSLASYAPSWKNTQVTRYHGVFDEKLKAKIADECVLGFVFNQKIIHRAPALVVVTYKHGISGYEKSGEESTNKGDKWEVFDAGIVTQTFSLAAHELGYGTVIMGIFDDKKVAEALELPEDEVVAALVPVGFAEKEPAAPPRKEVSELLTIR